MPCLLTAPMGSGWPLFAGLLQDLLRFLEPYLRAPDLCEAIKQLYKGCLRLLLVLLHDFPEFLCEHHFSLCEAIPPPAVQVWRAACSGLGTAPAVHMRELADNSSSTCPITPCLLGSTALRRCATWCCRPFRGP
jgi:hypothetical protein